MEVGRSDFFKIYSVGMEDNTLKDVLFVAACCCPPMNSVESFHSTEEAHSSVPAPSGLLLVVTWFPCLAPRLSEVGRLHYEAS